MRAVEGFGRVEPGDPIDVAIDELASYGLLHQHDGWLLATQPTVHTARLLG